MEHAKHIIRAVLLLVLVAVAFVFVRHFAIPESFGEHGHFRYDNVAEHAQHPLQHGTSQMCLECHDDEDEAGEFWPDGKHNSVACETCHAPLRTHIDEGGNKIGQMASQRSFKLCARCHQRLAARPKDFPQVVLPDHVTEQDPDMEFTDDVCWECHDNVHDPGQ